MFRLQNLKVPFSNFKKISLVKKASYSHGVYEVGSTINGWKVCESEHVPLFDATVTTLQHLDTGAKFCNILRKDTSNVFSIAFPTAPKDNTGTPHILEHTVLCGSKNYPIRDPFFKMLNRSLASYMNAWTCPTFTMYPFCVPSGNVTDISNLRSVYFDAVFNPLLRKSDFHQEGWRFEINEREELILKGIVYNEMKGAFSDAESVFSSKLFRSISPLNKESGGDPVSIPMLSYEDLVAFHSNCYHPNKAYFFAYGTHSLEEHLSFISKQFSSMAISSNVSFKAGKEFITGLPDIKDIPKLTKTTGPSDPLGLEHIYQGRYIKCWLINDLADPTISKREINQLSFDLALLSSLLLDGPSSPMYKSLIDSGLSRTGEYSPSTGYDVFSSRIATLGIGLSGLNVSIQDEIDMVDTAIKETLEMVGKEGFHSKRIKALLHSMELSLCHISANFGLGLAQRIIQAWITVDSSPIELMRVHDRFENLRSTLRITNGDYFKMLLRTYILDNPRSMTFLMEADPNYHELGMQQETKRLQSIKASLSDEEKSRIFAEAILLKEDQRNTPDISSLPCLSETDISKKNPFEASWNIERRSSNGLSQFSNPASYTRTDFTNNILYLKTVGNDILSPTMRSIHGLLYQQLLNFPVLFDCISEIGVENRDMDDYVEDVKLHTGGISADLEILIDYKGKNNTNVSICPIISSHCISRNSPRLFDLLEETFKSPNFKDLTRLRNIISSISSTGISSISDSGHSYAMLYASASIFPPLLYKELLEGITQIFYTSTLSKAISSSTEPLQEYSIELKENWGQVLSSGICERFSLLGSEESVTSAACEMAIDLFSQNGVLSKTTTTTSFSFSDKFTKNLPIPDGTNTYFDFPFPVSSTACSFVTVPWLHEESPKFKILASILSSKFLHREIRETNGAYGGGATFSDLSGLFSFYSYRDPLPLESLIFFKKSIEWFKSDKGPTEQDVLEAKLAIFKSIDAPVDINSVGMTEFIYNLNDSERQERRKSLLSISLKDIKKLVDKWWPIDTPGPKTCSVIIGGNLNHSLEDDSNWRIITSDDFF